MRNNKCAVQSIVLRIYGMEKRRVAYLVVDGSHNLGFLIVCPCHGWFCFFGGRDVDAFGLTVI